MPPDSGRGRGNGPPRNTPELSVLNKADPQEKPVTQSPHCWGVMRAQLTGEKRDVWLQSTLAFLSHLRRQNKPETHCEVHSLGHRLARTLRPNPRTARCTPSSTPRHHVTRGLSILFYQLTLPGTSWPAIKKLQGIRKGKHAAGRYRACITTRLSKDAGV